MFKEELILAQNNRISAIPLDPRFADVWRNYKTQLESFWVAEKIKFQEDVKYFNVLPEDIKRSIKLILGFFAGSDEIVEENLQTRFLKEITIPEIQYAYSFQAMMENVHSEVYNLMILNLMAGDERERLFRAVERMPSVSAKAAWARKWIASDQPYAIRCIAFACVEGILFSSSFAFIDYLKTQNYRLDGLYESNDYISSDEARHTELACIIYGHIVNKANAEEVKAIIDEAVEVELQFVLDVIPGTGYVGMNHQLMFSYVKHCAAILAADLGYPDIYKNSSCPFAFSKKRSLNSKFNFFERESNQYNMYGVGQAGQEFSTESDF